MSTAGITLRLRSILGINSVTLHTLLVKSSVVVSYLLKCNENVREKQVKGEYLKKALSIKLFKGVGSTKILFSYPLSQENLVKIFSCRFIPIVMRCQYTGEVIIRRVFERSLGYEGFQRGGEYEDTPFLPNPAPQEILKKPFCCRFLFNLMQ